jgi:hypothetical protein
MGNREQIFGAGRNLTSTFGKSAPAISSAILSLNLIWSAACLSAESATLWEIGKPDGDNREFALAPSGYAQLREDAAFFVGESDPARDWPYAHPGPADSWAGGRSHTFIVVFRLKDSPPEGEARLKLKLLDTHSSGPPKLEFRLNETVVTRNLSAGAGDESIQGHPAKGKPRALEIVFPAGALKAGENQLAITTMAGSWMLYDSLALETPAGAVLAPVANRTLVTGINGIRALKEDQGKLFHPVLVSIRQVGEPCDANIRISSGAPRNVRLEKGVNTVELLVPQVKSNATVQVSVESAGKLIAQRDTEIKPVRPLTVYVLPHSHTDIGYTEIQTAIEDKQVQNLVDGMAAAKRTASYPEGSRFVWNVEVLWAADLYLRRLGAQQRADFLDAVKRGQVALCGMYLNELTGLCRPEELVRLFRYATQLADETGRPIDSVMISDVPGYTWGTVTAMAHAGIRYFNTAPNYFDRIGTILREWENKPFWWVGPDGKSKVLVWIPFWGYAMSHRYGQFSPKLVEDFYDGLEQRGYPYDIAHVRWSGHGDNAVPDPVICEFVRDWNAKYAWPRFVISGVSEAFRAFEQKHGAQLPLVRGDWTPYWEDGAGSSALETAMNRESSDRLTQAEALWAMLDPKSYPRAAFEDAWNNVLLYSEHTWGAHCSVWGPERQETKEQWEIKRGYALAAEQQSQELLGQGSSLSSGTGISPAPGAPASLPASTAGHPHAGKDAGAPRVDVFNTASWPRTELVTLSKELSASGDRVLDDRGKAVPSQRLLSGELVFLANGVPALGTKRFSVGDGQPHVAKRATATGAALDSGRVRVRLDEQTGAIIELTAKGIEGNFADTSSGRGLNDYLYLVADDLKDLQRNGPVTIRVGEPGPLVASLIVESGAPGCRKLTREVRVVADMDFVELINDLDKERVPPPAKAEHPEGDYRNRAAKESVNFAFEFNVPGGDVRLDLSLGVMRPKADQMPSACKNWFTVGRWADVANRDCGIQWVTLDAPLVQVGGITATLLNSQTNPDVWRKDVEPTQKLYSWAMNNHWGTNYRAYQEGPTRFRFILRPYRKSDPAENSRFATGFSQPLLPLPARSSKPDKAPLLKTSSEDVLVTGLKPSDDGRALIIRLFGASGKTETVKLDWGDLKPKIVSATDTSENPHEKVGNRVTVPGYGLVSLRAELE